MAAAIVSRLPATAVLSTVVMIRRIKILGMHVASLLGAVMFLEKVHPLSGIDTRAVQSVFHLHVPAIVGTVMPNAVSVVAANRVVDVLRRWTDPRIRAAA